MNALSPDDVEKFNTRYARLIQLEMEYLCNIPLPFVLAKIICEYSHQIDEIINRFSNIIQTRVLIWDNTGGYSIYRTSLERAVCRYYFDGTTDKDAYTYDNSICMHIELSNKSFGLIITIFGADKTRINLTWEYYYIFECALFNHALLKTNVIRAGYNLGWSKRVRDGAGYLVNSFVKSLVSDYLLESI